MKFIIISDVGDGFSMAQRLSAEGNDVTFFNFEKGIDEDGQGFKFKRLNKRKNSLEGLIRRNKDAIFIFDGSEHGKKQDEMRRAGYKVIGSSSLGDMIEKDRMEGIKLCKDLKIKTPETIEIDSLDNAIEYIRKNPDKYIIKQTGDLYKGLNSKAYKDDSSDLAEYLINLNSGSEKYESKFVLQKMIKGYEVAVCGLFQGTDWARDKDGNIILEINYENKNLLCGGRGTSTGELGTLVRFKAGENEIFKKTLKPLTPKLRAINHYGCVDANCGLTDEGEIYVYEHTIRFGYPVTDIYIELCKTDFGQMLSDWANNKPLSFNYDNWGCVLLLAFPMYPYETKGNEECSFKGEIIDVSELTEAEENQVHLYYISKKNIKGIGERYIISSDSGYALTVTEQDKDFNKANDKAVNIIKKIIPSAEGFYRDDIAEACKKRISKTKEITGL